jgi:hypothetical protein
MNTKSPECYTTGPQARCLRIEISPGRLFLLPLDQFAFAEFTADDKEELLHLSFATHEIMVRGNALRRIETALHRLELSSIRPLAAKYHPVLSTNSHATNSSGLAVIIAQ